MTKLSSTEVAKLTRSRYGWDENNLRLAMQWDFMCAFCDHDILSSAIAYLLWNFKDLNQVAGLRTSIQQCTQVEMWMVAEMRSIFRVFS